MQVTHVSAAPSSVHTTQNHHSFHRGSSSSYEDRLCLAHVAVMTIGLVALLGAWPDPVQGFCCALSVCLLVLFGAFLYAPAFSFANGVAAWQVQLMTREREALAVARDLAWYRHANHQGVPPPISLVSCSGGKAVLCSTQAALPLFCFPKVCFTFGG